MDDINKLHVAENGDIYVGGEFVGSPGYSGDTVIAKWNGYVFSAIETPGHLEFECPDSLHHYGIIDDYHRCKHCGVKYEQHEKFCEGCGAPL
jgi:hypothetical protein